MFKKNALNALNPTGVNEDFNAVDGGMLGRRPDAEGSDDQSDEPLGNVREELVHPDAVVTVGMAAEMIANQLREQEKHSKKTVKVPGFGYERCSYKRIADEAEALAKPKKEKPI